MTYHTSHIYAIYICSFPLGQAGVDFNCFALFYVKVDMFNYMFNVLLVVILCYIGLKSKDSNPGFQLFAHIFPTFPRKIVQIPNLKSAFRNEADAWLSFAESLNCFRK